MRSYQFGPFRLDKDERVLTCRGRLVRLTPKVFGTLLALVEGRGRVMDKEELLRAIWPDTFVEEVNLAQKVSVLRRVLSEETPADYIETIPRRGYRFLPEVRELSEPGSPEPFATRGRVPLSRVVWSGSGLAAGLLIGLIAVSPLRGLSKTPASVVRVAPFTSFQGRETHPAFSPDGSRLAFVWDGPGAENIDIYVKLVGAETPLRLTTDAAADTMPAWAPDGTHVAFLRQSAGHSAYYLVPALGGAERRLADVFPYQDPREGTSAYYSPDGKHLAIRDKAAASEPFGLWLLAIETGTKRRITTPPRGCGDYYPAFSPDGGRLAFVRATSGSTNDLYLLALAGGEPRRLTFDGLVIPGLAWTADGREIVFASKRGGGPTRLWRVPAGGGTPERVEGVGHDVLAPAVSPRGDRLAYTEARNDTNIWRIDLEQTERTASPEALVASTFWDHGPDYSPDARQIAFASNRSGGDGIWVCESDGSKPRLLYDAGPYVTGTPRWSPDGAWIAFDSRSSAPGTAGDPDIYLIRPEGGPARRLTADPAVDVAPSWSRDGRWIYFASNRDGATQVWKAPLAGGPAIRVTRSGGFEAFESHDGRHVYYTHGRGLPGIWRVPAEGGEEVSIVERDQAGLWRYWRPGARGIYFVTAADPGGPRLELFDFATGRVKEVAPLGGSPDRHIPGLAVSPDERHLLYAPRDADGSDIMMAEGFR